MDIIIVCYSNLQCLKLQSISVIVKNSSSRHSFHTFHTKQMSVTCTSLIIKFSMYQNSLENHHINTHQDPNRKPNTHPTHTSISSHYQRHIVQLAKQELDSYCNMLEARIINKHVYVANVLNYQVWPQKQTRFSQAQENMNILVCTDRMIPLGKHDWTQNNLIKILQGLKRLAMIYGPFGVGARQLCKNEYEEIKVWTCKSAQKCRIDFSVSSEKDMLRQLAMLLDNKNSQLAFRINAASTLRQAIEDLNTIFIPVSPNKHQKNLQCYGLRLHKKIFSSHNLNISSKKIPNSPNTQNKSLNQHFQLTGSTKHQPTGKMFFSNNQSILSSKMISRQHSKISNPFYQEELIGKGEFAFQKNYSEIAQENKRLKCRGNACHQLPKPKSRHVAFRTFKKIGNRSPDQHFFQRPGCQRAELNNLEGSISNFDITIINNNYMGKSAQNKGQSRSFYSKYSSQVNSMKPNAKLQVKSTQEASVCVNSSKQGKKDEPYYFAQKKKPQSSFGQYSLDGQEGSFPNLKRTNNTADFQAEAYEPIQFGRRDIKLFTFFNPKAKQQKYQNLVGPPAVTNSNKHIFFKKNTPSYTNALGLPIQFFPAKNPTSTNNTTQLHQGQDAQRLFNSFATDPLDEQLLSVNQNTKSATMQQTSASSKQSELKKQLKMQFGNLFSVADAIQSSASLQCQQVNKVIVHSQSKTQLLKEGILKEKIKQKNKAFAQLKKEALKVLNDF